MKLLLVLLAFLSFTSFSQNSDVDGKSQAILDKLSTKMKAQKSFYIEFSANIKNTNTGTNENVVGKGWVKDSKYYVSYGDNTIISNGMKTWTVVKEDKTCYETDADEDEEEQSLNPKKLMTIWENGFKNKHIKETTLNNEKVDVINLFPKKAGDVEYHTITLYISKSANELKKVVMKMKDGTVMTYNLKKFTSNPTISDSKFVYNSTKYPGYTLIRD